MANDKDWAKLLMKFTELDYRSRINFVKAAAGIAGVDLAPRPTAGPSSKKSSDAPPPSKKKGGAATVQQPQRQKSPLEKDFLLAKKTFVKARKSAGLGPEDASQFDEGLKALFEDYEAKMKIFFAFKEARKISE